MVVNELWQYQTKNWLRQFAWYLGVVLLASTIIAALISTFWGITAAADIFPVLRWLAMSVFFWWMMSIAGKMVTNWRFLVECGYQRQRLFVQGTIIALVFSAVWSLLLYLPNLLSSNLQLWIFQYDDFGDYGKTLAAGWPRHFGNYVLTLELVMLIVAVSFLLAIINARFSQPIFVAILIIGFSAYLLLTNLLSHNEVASQILKRAIGYDPSGPDQPLPLIITGAATIIILWLLNDLLWRGYESRKLDK